MPFHLSSHSSTLPLAWFGLRVRVMRHTLARLHKRLTLLLSTIDAGNDPQSHDRLLQCADRLGIRQHLQASAENDADARACAAARRCLVQPHQTLPQLGQ